MAEKKAPKQLRITFKEQCEYERTDDGHVKLNPDGTGVKIIFEPLGFANVYDPHTSAYEKRQATQDAWAYNGNAGYIVRDGKYWSRTARREVREGLSPEEARLKPHGEGYCVVVTDTLVPEDLQPIIIDNKPLEGFRIQHMVSRYKGNKLWRILDPRGFELEIASGTFENIVMTGVVDRGLIIGPCVWKSAKQLVRV